MFFADVKGKLPENVGMLQMMGMLEEAGPKYTSRLVITILGTIVFERSCRYSICECLSAVALSYLL